MPGSDVIETTVAEVTAELLRRGSGADEPVSSSSGRSKGWPLHGENRGCVLSPPVLPTLISAD
jgi:hypothetical protein